MSNTSVPFIRREELTDEDMCIVIRPRAEDSNQVDIAVAGGSPVAGSVAHSVGVAMMVFLSENQEAFQKRYVELLDEWSAEVDAGTEEA